MKRASLTQRECVAEFLFLLQVFSLIVSSLTCGLTSCPPAVTRVFRKTSRLPYIELHFHVLDSQAILSTSLGVYPHSSDTSVANFSSSFLQVINACGDSALSTTGTAVAAFSAVIKEMNFTDDYYCALSPLELWDLGSKISGGVGQLLTSPQ